MTASLPLRLEAITLRYPNGTVAVKGIDLTVNPGEVFGLVGPNGAGKSSLLNCAAGLITPQSGRVICGSEEVTGDPCKTACSLTLMPDPLGVYREVTGAEYLEFFARAFGIPEHERKSKISETVKRLELEPWLHHEVETLSAGWQRRLSLGRVLLSDAPIMLLDEPAAGLDVSARSALLAIVRSIASEGRTVILTSHILPELEQLADRFGIIQNGSWAAIAPNRIFFTREDLRMGFGQGWKLECSDVARAREILGADKTEEIAEGKALLVKAANDEEAAALLSQLVGAGIKVYSFQLHSTGLSELTLQLLNRPKGSD